jgi:hypothetical protein
MGVLRHQEDMMEQSESASSGDEGDNSGSATGTSMSFPDQLSAGEDARRMEIIEREEKRVRKARYALAATMILCASAVTAAVFVSTKNKEYDVFVRKVRSSRSVSLTFLIKLMFAFLINQFQVYSNDVIDNAQWQTDYNFRLMQQLSADMTSTALLQNDVFPNVTHPHFDISAGYADGFGGFLSSFYAPIITDLHREEWEDYSQSNTWWIDESDELRIDHPGHLHQTHIHYLKSYVYDELGKNGKGMNKHNVSEYIFRYVNGSKVNEPHHSAMSYAPLWQVTPPEPDVINVNLFSDELLFDLFMVMIAMNRTVQSKSTHLDNFFDFVLNEDSMARKQHPHAFLAEPVYDVFAKNAKVVGVLFALAPFDNLFNDILDENAKGIICVISDSCGSTITFEINGPNVTFFGYGDFHDPKYDKFANVANLELYESMVDGLCVHKVHVYPSSVFAQEYFTSQPAVFASTVALSFVLMAVVVLIYDQMITKRQEKTMKSALRSGALVASLFPENVRDRLMDEIDAKQKKHGKDDEKKNESTSVLKSRPIADFFPSTTLMCKYLNDERVDTLYFRPSLTLHLDSLSC